MSTSVVASGSTGDADRPTTGVSVSTSYEGQHSY